MMDVPYRIANVAGLNVLARLSYGCKARIIMYHGIVDDGTEPECWWLLKISAFKKQIEYLCKHYQVISIDEAIEGLLNPQGQKRNEIVLTFDDGYRGYLTYAYPVLKQYNIPSTVYLTTGPSATGRLIWVDRLYYGLMRTRKSNLNFVDIGLGQWPFKSIKERLRASEVIINHLKRLPKDAKGKLSNLILSEIDESCLTGANPEANPFSILSPQEIKFLGDDEKVTIGAHTENHEVLTNLPLYVAIDEIIKSKTALEKWTGRKVEHFAYPNGNYNAALASCVKQLGFKSAATINPSRAEAVERYQLGRIGIGAWDSMDIFKCKVAGITNMLAALKSAMNKLGLDRSSVTI